MCLESNIPIHKLEHPAVREYLAKQICTCSGDLPGASTLRNNYVPACGEEMKLKVKAAFKDKPVVIVADETAGSKGSQEMIDCIKEYDVVYNNILDLVSDSARYMGKCFQALQTIVGDHLLHFQCLAHKLNLVGDIFLKEFSSLNLLVSKLKMAFLHSRKMRNKYLSCIKESYPSLPSILFPAPVTTRWDLWFKALQYLNTYVDVRVDFLLTKLKRKATAAVLLV
ncbi:hypothetical protein PR048_011931 [Dryococelus australis]|uniref:DUF659 domain-containing protein n=1 Tax=Dryococelus australis TaxID=614101 RepID=A0ABQ9HN16_9NEOP|nr:hypothetical protein PR048_011931 [Dryococelus australis]